MSGLHVPQMLLSEEVQVPPAYKAAVVAFLRRYYERRKWELQEGFFLYDLPLFTEEQLLRTPLAEALASIARASTGERVHDEVADGVLAEEIQDLAERLFAAPGMPSTYSIPPEFWETPIGAMVALAQLWLHEDAALMTLTDAAARAGVSLPAVSQAIDAGRLRAYYDPNSVGVRHGRRLVARGEVDAVWPQKTE